MNFDWLIENSNNVTKVLEGNYNGKPKAVHTADQEAWLGDWNEETAKQLAADTLTNWAQMSARQKQERLRDLRAAADSPGPPGKISKQVLAKVEVK